MCPSMAACLSDSCCFSELALLKHQQNRINLILCIYWMVSFPNALLFFSVGGFNLIKIRIGLSIQNIYLTEAISLFLINDES
jgi:hypothetical protein